MPSPKGNYYITTAIAYASAKPHIGNAYEIVLADAIARYRRAEGYEVFFMTGTDEHGQKVELKAAEEGISPQAYVDRVSAEVRRVYDAMNVSYNKFMRTTDADHVAACQRIFRRLYDQGDIYKGSYEGWYCVPCESFFTESQLDNGCCPDCGRPVVKEKEEAYFFRMSRYQDRLMKHIEENPSFIQPESRKREMVNNFLRPGLKDLCVSRSSIKWGVPVDFDPEHVLYVWIDALSNYITGIGFDGDKGSELYEKFWPANVHLIGKDILRFHTIYWPIFLMALGEELPKQVFGHPWMLMNGMKMSKSVGNIIYADEMVARFSVDAVRYYMLREMPFAQDGSITYEEFLSRYNSDLANNLGNLVNRSVSMSRKYFNGEIQKRSLESVSGEDAPIAAFSREVEEAALAAVKTVSLAMQDLRVADAVDAVMELCRRLNKYIDETAPWALAKQEEKKETLGTVLTTLLEGIRFAGVLLEPFLPDTGKAVLDQLCAKDEARTLDSLAAFAGLCAGDAVGEPKALFQRLDETKVLEEILAEKTAKEPEEASCS